MPNKRYLIAGASGFIGSRVFNALQKSGVDCVGLGRKVLPYKNYISCDLMESSALRDALSGVTCVINCAGYAHAFKASSSEIKRLAWLNNYSGTKNLLKIGAEMGVEKFINLSSVKAMGEPGSVCANEEFEALPETEYGLSKLAAEKLVIEAHRLHNIHAVNLRLSMVYGRGGGGNLGKMAVLIKKKLFPPLPETGNRRSLVHVNDVVSAVVSVINDPRAAGETFIVSGPHAYSGRQIFNKIRNAYGFADLDFEVPRWVLAAFIKKEMLGRLLDSACYSNKKIEQLLDWRPQISIEAGLAEMLSNLSLSETAFNFMD